ncbi:hypothetical protein NPS29_16765 [Pseudomonas putida]|uniref:hypothetical protein n=1 Tax=Pseudomonas putida TaxID=303 RepID=UPI0023633629|nr:hypothetical protein [Pseudomonas putida]MDD1966983.1 hypothetical protein [Pseudomonas putida]
MGKKLELWGIAGTFTYLLVIAVTVALRLTEFKELKLNELGDFLAGVFGPVAFFWLVLGFIQQGQELRLSSDALRMQAEELKASVEQQTALVDAQKSALENHERSLEPLLQVHHTGSINLNGELHDTFNILNHGPFCRNVVADFIGRDMALPGMQVSALATGGSQRFRSSGALPYDQPWKLQLTYEKANGQISSQSFGMIKRVVEGVDFYMVFEDKAFIEAIAL